MIIEKAEVIHVRLPLKVPFRISTGVLDAMDTLIVKLWSEDRIGYGESVCQWTPLYSYETTRTGIHIIKDFILPQIVKADLDGVDDLLEKLGHIKGHNLAKSGVEMAFWDLTARTKGVPLHRLLGAERQRVPTGVSIGLKPSIRELLDSVARFLEQGYQRIKIKIGPGLDVELVKAVRKEFGGISLMADGNSAYCLGDIDLLKRLDEYDLMMIEQPLHHDDIVDHARLQAQITTPICLDESIKNREDARKAIELGSCRIINIKLTRVGGHAETKAIHDLCQEHDVPVWCGSMLESGIGEAHNLAAAGLPNFKIPGDIAPSDRYFEGDIVNREIELNHDGTIDVPQQAGIGLELDEEKLRRYTVGSFSAGGAAG